MSRNYISSGTNIDVTRQFAERATLNPREERRSLTDIAASIYKGVVLYRHEIYQERRGKVSCRCAAIHCLFKQAMPGSKEERIGKWKEQKTPPNAHLVVQQALCACTRDPRISNRPCAASCCVTTRLFGLRLCLERQVRVHPTATKREQHTEPLARVQDLAFAVPPNG
jgi:hypothetical protein